MYYSKNFQIIGIDMDLIKVKDVADMLGVHEQTVYSWMRKKENPIPHYNKIGTLRFDKEEVLAWFKGRE